MVRVDDWSYRFEKSMVDMVSQKGGGERKGCDGIYLYILVNNYQIDILAREVRSTGFMFITDFLAAF